MLFTQMNMCLTTKFKDFAMFHFTHNQINPLREKITATYRKDEATVVAELFKLAQFTQQEQSEIMQRARELAEKAHAKQVKLAGASAFIRDFSLSQDGHIALAALVESLLRIPDETTRYKLVWDKLNEIDDWERYSKHSKSALVNLGSLGLRLRNKDNEDNTPQATWVRVAEKNMEQTFRMLAEHFTAGEDFSDAMKIAKKKAKQGYDYAFDLSYLPAQTQTEANRAYDEYERAIRLLGDETGKTSVYSNPHLALKLSALFPRYEHTQRDRVMMEFYPKIKNLYLLAKRYNVAMLIDSEESETLEMSLDIIEELLAETELSGFAGLGFTVQAYQKRSMLVIRHLIELAEKNQQKIMIRLVKGGFWDSEIKNAQARGLNGYSVFTQKPHTELSFLVCARILLANPEWVYPQFATHNPYTIAAIEKLGGGQAYEFQILQGAGEFLFEQLIDNKDEKRKQRFRICAPVGSVESLLSYLVRRLAESVAADAAARHIIHDGAFWIQSPQEEVLQTQGKMNANIVLPRFLYGRKRPNPNGLDFSSDMVLMRLQELMNQAFDMGNIHAVSIIAMKTAHGNPISVVNPADHNDMLGSVSFMQMGAVYNVIATAKNMEKRWANTTPDKRTELLLKTANLIEARMPELMALIMRETGKTLESAIREIRQAVDFCRYYAIEAESTCVARAPIGTVLAISPWNTPLSVFVGQIAAALVVGNTVIAKPSQFSSLTAFRMIQIMHEAGFAKAVLQLVLSDNGVAEALVRDQRINGVLFTGSIDVAKHINQILAERADLPVFIAETGGQNAMIADSSASLEQLCHDVILSAFGSAGQNANALRILCVQEDIADAMIDKIQGAMDELQIGNPMDISTDIGPIINQAAQKRVLAHVDKIKSSARFFHQTLLPEEYTRYATFVPPTVIELHDLDKIQHEVFGPVLHILRYRAEDLGRMIDQINGKGYALSVGIHSRINHTINYAANRIEAGSIYINRDLKAITAGVQPLGGHGLSGTGPKAGASFYLQKLTQGRWQPPKRFTRWGQIDKNALSAVEQLLAEGSFSREEQLQFALALGRLNNNPTLRLAQFTMKGQLGEHNVMTWRAPKHVWLHGGTLAEALVALIPMLASGIQVVIDSEHPLAAHQSTLANWVRLSENPMQQPFISHVLCLEKPTPEWKTQLAQRTGAIVKIVDASDGNVDVLPLFEEVVFCNNKTAMGADFNLLIPKEKSKK